ncbi:hypothetical protein Goklo_012618 [Gossypium klotzschianum]|uniref:Uncharacterized protein n=1 Tax=Gossypium klotzschianum TaxID=34286 RepID=A0A7J8VDJ1_9ROSI|nr:hypothetical protein [Gossypium klotzschianum]
MRRRPSEGAYAISEIPFWNSQGTVSGRKELDCKTHPSSRDESWP